MSAEHLKSQAITDMTATPRVPVNANKQGGVLRESIGLVTPDAAAEAASTYRFLRLPSNCRVSEILVKNAAFTTGGAIDIGLYETAENGGAVVDADLFASAQVMTAAQDFANKTYESTEYTLAESEKMLWQVLGLATDPCKDYDLAATVTTAFNGGQPFAIKARFVS